MALNLNQNLSLILSKIDTDHIQNAVKRATDEYDIKAYKIEKISKEDVFCHFLELQKNNFTNGVVSEENEGYQLSWRSKQLKIFVWVLVIYIFQQQADLKKLNQQQWDFLQSIFANKNPLLLRFQTQSLLKHKKSSWTHQEDELLRSIIKEVEEKTKYYWNQVSKRFFIQSNTHFFKSPKQCRQRWFNHLAPNKTKKHWSDEEDYKILKNVQKYGKKWALVAKIMDYHRTGHDIKNRYYSMMKKMQNREIELGKSSESQKKQSCQEASSRECLATREQAKKQSVFEQGDPEESFRRGEEMNSLEIDQQLDEIQDYIQKQGLFIFAEQI